MMPRSNQGNSVRLFGVSKALSRVPLMFLNRLRRGVSAMSWQILFGIVSRDLKNVMNC